MLALRTRSPLASFNRLNGLASELDQLFDGFWPETWTYRSGRL